MGIDCLLGDLEEALYRYADSGFVYDGCLLDIHLCRSEGLGMENGISQIIGFAITIVVLAFFLVWKKKTGNI